MSDARVQTGLPQPQGFGEDPLTKYTKVFTKFLQLVFASFEKGSYRWDADQNNSDIIILGEATLAQEAVEKRPAIIVARGPVAFTNVSIDQFAGPLLDKTGKFTPNMGSDGSRRHTDLLASSMTYNCLSREGIEAQRIAWIAAYATRALKRSLMQIGIHRVGEDLSVSSESPPGAVVQPDTQEVTMVSVNVPFFFQQTWTVAPVDKTLLTQVSIALRSEVGIPDADGPVLKGPGMNGFPLTYEKATSLDQVVVIRGGPTPAPRK